MVKRMVGMMRTNILLSLGIWMGIGLTAGVSLISGCKGQEQPQAVGPSRPDDEAVIESVLLHFLQDEGKDADLGSGKELVLLQKSSPEKTGMVLPDQVNIYLQSHNLPDSLIDALYLRNKGKKEYDALRTDFSRMSFDKRIVVGDFNAAMGDRGWSRDNVSFAKFVSRARGCFECYAPGYSADRKTALVRAWIGPSAHGAIATYLLERSDATWQVKWREFTFFV